MDVDFGQGIIDDPLKPACQRSSRVFAHVLQELRRIPANPRITLANLDDGTRQRSDTDNGMKLGGSISDEKWHRSPGRADVLICPRMAKVPPDLQQLKARPWAALTRLYKLQIWIDHTIKRSGLCAARRAKRLREFTTI